MINKATQSIKDLFIVVEGVPRWPAALALIAIGLTYLLLPPELIFGPRWLVLIVSLVAFFALPFARAAGMRRLTHLLALSGTTFATIVIAVSALFLVSKLQNNDTAATILLRDAAILWCINIITFALWYWQIDGGGPAKRHLDHHQSTDFLFPQMTLDDKASKHWSPTFIDYVFLAFNTSTAFSPTDTLVLSRRAKLLMMAQSLISLIVIAVLAARAVNTL